MKNYYEILEINESASPEVIEKVYKVLAKKYHPDMHEESNKKWAEEKFKEVTEAYEILSDEFKRAEYDKSLKIERMKENTIREASNNNFNKYPQYNNHHNNNFNKNNNISQNHEDNYEDNKQKYDKLSRNKEKIIKEEIKYQKQKAYNDAYIDALKSMGYKIKYKKTFKDYLRILLFIIILIIMFSILWIIPPIRNNLISLYENNLIIKWLVDTTKMIFTSTFNSIFTIFTT